ncbi:MAG: tetratricopeptide repeat protein [Pseudomonadales bacterium]|nr:tetratricopeptide repeat protein [Pseudomonadales bacterium]
MSLDELDVSLDNPAFLREFNRSFEVGLRPGAPGLDPRESVILQVVSDMYLQDLDAALDFIQDEVRRRAQEDRRARGAGEHDYVYSANIEFAIGQLYQLKGDEDLALEYYRQAIEKYPAYVDAYVRMLEIYLLQEDCPKVFSAGHSALEIGGSNGSIFKGFGICHYLEGNYDEALSAFRISKASNPEDESTSYSLALSALNTGATSEAIAVLDELIAGDATNASYYMLQVNAFLQDDNYEGALNTILIANRFGLLTSDSFALLGNMFINKQMPELALTAFTNGLQQTGLPEFETVMGQFDQLSALEDWDSAEAFWQAIAQAYSGSLNTARQNAMETRNARILLARGQRVEAAAALRRVIDTNPTDGQALLSLAQLLKLEQDFEQADIYYQRAAEEESVALSALTEHAQMAADREDWQLAINLLTQAADIAPDEARSTIQGNIRALLRVQEFAQQN